MLVAHISIMRPARLLSVVLSFVVLACASAQADEGFGPTTADLQKILASEDYTPLKEYGDKAIVPLLQLYVSGDDDTKRRVANALYLLAIKSEHARELLLKDAHTENRDLRLSVQYALGRVSNDATVVQTLLDNMRNDPSPLFRDKAACALTYDQVHLTEQQRVILFEGLVAALEDEKDDVRRIALLSLQIQTGQTKGYNPAASADERKVLVEPWKAWVAEYRKNIDGK